MNKQCIHKETKAQGIIQSELEAHAEGKFPAQYGIYWTSSGDGSGHYYWNDQDKIEILELISKEPEAIKEWKPTIMAAGIKTKWMCYLNEKFEDGHWVREIFYMVDNGKILPNDAWQICEVPGKRKLSQYLGSITYDWADDFGNFPIKLDNGVIVHNSTFTIDTTPPVFKEFKSPAFGNTILYISGDHIYRRSGYNGVGYYVPTALAIYPNQFKVKNDPKWYDEHTVQIWDKKEFYKLFELWWFKGIDSSKIEELWNACPNDFEPTRNMWHSGRIDLPKFNKDNITDYLNYINYLQYDTLFYDLGVPRRLQRIIDEFMVLVKHYKLIEKL